MWTSLDRTRHRLRRLFEVPTALLAVGDPGTEPPPPADDVVLTMGRPELDRLGIALQDLLGPMTARPDTPARLETALEAAVRRMGGSGRPRVTRRPPGLTTPEAWQVRLTNVDPSIGEAIRHAARSSAF
ncbi:MAG: hypothetical protein WEC14_06420, partial [Chloroflexota bacterium]